MPVRYRLLEIDGDRPPADVKAAVPYPLLGVDASLKPLNTHAAYLLSRIDGMTSIGDLLRLVPMPPFEVLEAIQLLHEEGLITFDAVFEQQYLWPLRDSVEELASPGATSRPSASPMPARPSASPMPARPSAAPPRPAVLPPAPRQSWTPPCPSVPSAAVDPAAATTPGGSGREPSSPVMPPVEPVAVAVGVAPGVPPGIHPSSFSRFSPSIPPPPEMFVPSSPSVLPVAGDARAPVRRSIVPLTVDRIGDLGTRPPAKLLDDLKVSRFVGTLKLRRNGVEKTLVFLAGEPVQAWSNSADDDIGALMFKKGKLDEEGVAGYRTLLKMGKPPMDALVEIGAVMAVDVQKADRWRAQAVLFDCLLWRDGEYEIDQLASFPEGVPRYDLTVASLMLKAWREAPFDDTRKKFLDAHRNWYVVPGRITDAVIARMRLNPKELRLMEALKDTARRIRDIFEISSLMFSETYKFLDGLLAMGLVELSEQNPTETGPVDPKELRGRLATMRDANHFDRLSTHPVSTDEDIDDAYRTVRPLYDLARYRNLRPETRETLVAILGLVDEAYEHLKVPEQRRAYRLSKYDRSRLEYFAEIQYKKGEIFLLWRQDARTALGIFESAHEMCRENPLYGVSYALASVRSFPGDRARKREARETVDRALGRGQVTPKVAVLAAAVFRDLGDTSRSEQLCMQALKASGNAPEIVRMVDQIRGIGEV